ncbi:hypothetical protein NDU88_004879 [Pleurodeles waltl]|uniref:Uncharacterized protein n=1 Tax=Pleurodeles waltl TaxID=8319 RepID=A0AAV7MCY1_PLEWA|nr:hypothetical protein NDU88_004879 [Pleurodeles waltl]
MQSSISGRGRGSVRESEVTGQGHMGSPDHDAHVQRILRIMRGRAKQALIPSETSGKRGRLSVEERQLGTRKNMAVPELDQQNNVIVVSDEEEETQAVSDGLISDFK